MAGHADRHADDRSHFVGVNTHLGYYDTTCCDYEGILKPRLLEPGVRHIRDGTFKEDVLRKYLDLGQHGIRLLLITDSKRAVEQARKLGTMRFAIEGVNESDGRGEGEQDSSCCPAGRTSVLCPFRTPPLPSLGDELNKENKRQLRCL